MQIPSLRKTIITYLNLSNTCKRYFFKIDGGKKIRPVMVLLVSYALSQPNSPQSLFATRSQKRLAEITEMIHTASLFHDDVIDKVGAHS